MVTKSDFRSIMDLHKQYTPATLHFLTEVEKQVIRTTLELDGRTNIELENIRNAVVMLYRQWIESARNSNDMGKTLREMDAMDAICTVIDQLKFERGMEC